MSWVEPNFKRMGELSKALKSLTQYVIEEEERKLKNFQTLQESLKRQREKKDGMGNDQS